MQARDFGCCCLQLPRPPGVFGFFGVFGFCGDRECGLKDARQQSRRRWLPAAAPGPRGASRLRLATVACALASLLLVRTAGADALPFLPPGDARLRHEVQLEADEGSVPIPLATTWPIPTRDLPADKRDSLHSEQQPGTSTDAGWFLDGASNPTRLRTFDSTPRESGEAGLQAGWAAGDYAGGVFRMSYALKPQDDKHYRFDDSYVAWRLGNWWFTAGEQQRWWGPGHDSSLILSNNARPLPQLAIERASSEAFETKWLSWIGPWRFTTFMGKLENDNSDFPHPLLWGARLTFRPVPWFEGGLSRVAQWCRPGYCRLKDFEHVLTGGGTPLGQGPQTGPFPGAGDHPGKQHAGYDLRVRSPWYALPLAYYWSWVGADFVNHWKPTKRLRQDGIEYWDKYADGTSLRVFLEYTDATCSAGAPQPVLHCAYEDSLFSGGYRTRGRVIGASVDTDGQLYTLGGIYVDGKGRSWQLRLRKGKLNHGALDPTDPIAQRNTVSGVRADLFNVEAQVDGRFDRFTYRVGVGGDRLAPIDRPRSFSGRVFLNLSVPWALQ